MKGHKGLGRFSAKQAFGGLRIQILVPLAFWFVHLNALKTILREYPFSFRLNVVLLHKLDFRRDELSWYLHNREISSAVTGKCFSELMSGFLFLFAWTSCMRSFAGCCFVAWKLLPGD